jgi:hypothetical protein
MAGKSALPLLLAAGVGAVLLTKKKPAKKKKKVTPEAKNNVVASGKVDRTSIPKRGELPFAYSWRVRKSNETYVAEAGRPSTIRETEVRIWKAIGEADTVEDAKEMALAWIDKQPGFESEPEVVDSGAPGTKGVWEWRVITDPERGFIGQYRLPDGQWLNAVEGPEYNNPFKITLWEVAEKDWLSKQGG